MADPPPQQFDVHLFPVIRWKCSGISASSPEEAIQLAQVHLPLDRLEMQLRDLDAEYAEEISHYLVDIVGDADFERSRFYHSSQELCLVPLRLLLAWSEGGRNEAVLVALLAEVREMLARSV